jgi:hypothetical protein
VKSLRFLVRGIILNTDELWSAFEHIHDFNTKPVLRKQHIAGIVARIFDPLGLLSPVTMMSKLMWQEYLLKHPKSSWDTEVPDSERKLWESQIDEPEKLQVLRFPRSILDHEADSHEFHVFGDASGKAIAVCMYSVPIKNGMRLKPD